MSRADETGTAVELASSVPAFPTATDVLHFVLQWCVAEIMAPRRS
jgi:hypothetical protein